MPNFNYEVLHADIVGHLKRYADELNNHYQVQSVPDFEKVLDLIQKLDGKAYKPTVWSR